MHLPLSIAAAPDLQQADECPSTNAALVASAAHERDFAVLVTGNQTAGRGRLAREWIAPAGQSLAVSVLLRPRLPVRAFSWLPLAAGLAMVEAIGEVLPPDRVALKWPNDVQIDGSKVCGVLAEVVPAGDAVVIGAGVNLAIPTEGLPTATSTSLMLEGATLEGDELADAVLSHYLLNLAALYHAYERAEGDAGASGLAASVRVACSTLGRTVRVELPGGGELVGTASDVDATGRLVVVTGDGAETAVSVGDVEHVRAV